MSNIGFIGVGYMGYGMAKNLLKKHNVYIFAHKNRKPVNKLIKIGAKELKTYSEIKNIKIDKDLFDKKNIDPGGVVITAKGNNCLLYTSPSPRDLRASRMPSSA